MLESQSASQVIDVDADAGANDSSSVIATRQQSTLVNTVPPSFRQSNGNSSLAGTELFSLTILDSNEETMDFASVSGKALAEDLPVLPKNAVLTYPLSERKQFFSSGEVRQNFLQREKHRVRGFRGMQAQSQPRDALKSPSTLSILDLAAMDLDKLRMSFIAHSQLLSVMDLDDMHKLAVNWAKEILNSEREAERQECKEKKGRVSHLKTLNDSLLTKSVLTDQEEVVNTANSALDAGDFLPTGSTEVVETSVELVFHKARLLNAWLYDGYVQQRFREANEPSTAGQRSMYGGASAFSSRSFLGGGGKAMKDFLRDMPTPTELRGFDIYDEIAISLWERETRSTMLSANAGIENLPVPFPTFVYVFTRAVFCMCYLDRFPRGLFPTCQLANVIGNSDARDEDDVKEDTFFFASQKEKKALLDEVSGLFDECRRTVINFFDVFDTEQKGVISWCTFTDSLMEQVEVQHRLMMVKESSEANNESDARVFDEYVIEPFPSVLQRLGYVGAAIEVRQSGSAILLEGTHDFALCDSSCSVPIQSKLLVRTVDLLFSHRCGAPEEWGAERWGAAADTFSSQQSQMSNKRILRYEDGRSREDDAAQKLLNEFWENVGMDISGEGEGIHKSIGDDRIDRRTKPSIESAILLKDVSPELPKTIVTLHNDLVLRFFNMDQHLWVIPESIIVACKETITTMDWCSVKDEGDSTLKFLLFLGTRSGYIFKVDLQSILRRMLLTKITTGEVITTGVAAAATIREKLEPFILQRQAFHTEVVTSVSVTSSGMLLSSSLDGTVVLSRASNLVVSRSFRVTHDAGVRFACITPLRNAIVTLSTGNRVSLWANAHQSSHVDLYDPISPHYFPIISIKVDESLDQLITVDSSGYVKVWNLRSNLTKMSFYAVSDKVFSTFRHMYDSANTMPHNGYRLFDEDETDMKRPRMQGDAGNQRDTSALLHTTLSTIEAANKARHLHPARYVAYDALTRRLFVTGTKNSVVCVFVSGSTGLKAHSAPLCHIFVCEQNRWILTVSFADCRLWSYKTGMLTLGLKANSPEFIMVRMAPVFGSRATPSTSAQLAAATGETDVQTLDGCKQSSPSLNDVMQMVTVQADASRRERARISLRKRLTASEAARRHAMRQVKGGIQSDQLLLSTTGNMTNNSSIMAFGESSSNNSGGVTIGDAVDGDCIKNQGASYRILCAHVDTQERFIFYALNNGDIRIHRTDSGRLTKTLLTTPPSTDLILAAVVQCRHLFTAAKRKAENFNSVYDEEEQAQQVAGAQMRVQEIAFILHRLLHHKKKLPLQQEERYSIHEEAVGMVTMWGTQELGVMYADGVTRFFSLFGNSVHAHRIVIPEFLVSRAVSYIRLERSIQRKLLTISSDLMNMGKDDESPEPHLNFIVEADAVSLITVSKALNYVCLVHVNGRVSVMDMTNFVGSLVQVFNVSGEVTTISFLGAYPCLVIADTQGCLSFYLVKGAAMLTLLEDFFKALVLRRRNQRHCLPQFSSLSGETIFDDNQKHNSATDGRMWWFYVPGTPTALHFDPVHCALYVGTRQGYFSSYLVRNLIIAFDLYPVLGSASSGKQPELHSALKRQQHESNEQRLCNVLLVFFGITPESVMSAGLDHFESVGLWRGARFGSCQAEELISSRSTEPLLTPSRTRLSSPSSISPFPTEPMCGVKRPKIWKNSLLWVYEVCGSLFNPPSLHTSSSQSRVENLHLPFDLFTVTLSDLLIGTAILRHILLLLSIKCEAHAETKKDSSQKTSKEAKAPVPVVAVTLTQTDLRHIRQCIAEELQYRKEAFFRCDERNETLVDSFTNGRVVEEEVDLEMLQDDSSEIPSAISADWVEFLFRRHLVNTASESPLSLLSTNAILERARYERYERGKLLQMQAKLEQEMEKEIIGYSTVSILGSGKTAAITVDCDAFIEGNSSRFLNEIFRRRRGGKATGEEEMPQLDHDGDEVRCIATRNNGLLFVGSANGSVVVWTPYGCARLQDLCPSSQLEESIYRLGRALKTRLAQEVDRVARLWQRGAYTLGQHNSKMHETKLRNLNVKYRATMMKRESARAIIKRNNSRDMFDASEGIFLGTGDQLITGLSIPNTRFYASLRSAGSRQEKAYSLLEKEKEMLLVLVNITPLDAKEKGILLEDLYFLPMHTTMLSELEEFNLEAYELAVNMAVERLTWEICRSNGGNNNNDDVDGNNGLDDKNGNPVDNCDKKPNNGRSPLPPHSRSPLLRTTCPGELNEAIHNEEDLLALSAHEKHVAAFYSEQKRQIRKRKMEMEYDASLGTPKQGNASSSQSVVSMEWRRCIFNRCTASIWKNINMSLPTSSERTLVARMRQSRGIGAGSIGVAVSTRRDRQLRGCFGLDLGRLSERSHWFTADEAINTIVSRSNGLASEESFSGLSNLLKHMTLMRTKQTTTEASATGKRDTGKGLQSQKSDIYLLEPLLLLSIGNEDSNKEIDDGNSYYNEQHQKQYQWGAKRVQELMSEFCQATRQERPNSASKERFTCFITETCEEAEGTLDDIRPSGPIVTSNNLSRAGSLRLLSRTASKFNSFETNSVHTEEGGHSALLPVLPMRWSMMKKKYFHRAKLSRTGRAIANGTRERERLPHTMSSDVHRNAIDNCVIRDRDNNSTQPSTNIHKEKGESFFHHALSSQNRRDSKSNSTGTNKEKKVALNSTLLPVISHQNNIQKNLQKKASKTYVKPLKDDLVQRLATESQ